MASGSEMGKVLPVRQKWDFAVSDFVLKHVETAWADGRFSSGGAVAHVCVAMERTNLSDWTFGGAKHNFTKKAMK